MNLLTIEKATKGYTDHILFDKVNFGIMEGDKVGVVGVNGTGKSTLLKMIAGLEEPDEGKITKGNNIKIAYLPQAPVFNAHLSIIENILADTEKEDQWNMEAEAKAMLHKLNIEDYTGDISLLSGGQRKRVALVRALLYPAEILVLDEPTNHLDSSMAEWLEDYLNQYRGSFVMVTHDRYFLDKVTNKILEIDNKRLYTYSVNYSGFIQLKAEREEMELAAERKKKSLYRVELEWMMRGARARSTKQKAHIQRFEELQNRTKPELKKNVEIDSVSSRLGRQTLELKQISKSYGDKILINNFSYIFLKDDRIGIIGKNGCGKTTLLKIINGIVQPDCGEVIIGQTVKVGYFSQENEYMDESLKVIDYIREAGEYVKVKEGSITASQMLERFLFIGSIQYSYINKLSGGEKRRLYLLRVLMEAPNILILDEPTNDLDIQTLTILEDYLDSFSGIVITVSHDRYFLDRTVSRIFAFDENGFLCQYEGGYTDYHFAKEQKATGEDYNNISKKQKTSNKLSEYKSKERKQKLKFSFKEQREYESIDVEIAELEEKLKEYEQQTLKYSTDFVKLKEIMNKKEEQEHLLEEKMERWVYLNDLAEKIKQEKN